MTVTYRISIYVPESHLEPVKEALFAAGAGRAGDYDRCCWQTQGQGQFRPLEGSEPFIGEQGRDEVVAEYKIELVCDGDHIINAVQAMIEAHPYESPAYDVYQPLAL